MAIRIILPHQRREPINFFSSGWTGFKINDDEIRLCRRTGALESWSPEVSVLKRVTRTRGPCRFLGVAIQHHSSLMVTADASSILYSLQIAVVKHLLPEFATCVSDPDRSNRSRRRFCREGAYCSGTGAPRQSGRESRSRPLATGLFPGSGNIRQG